MEETETGEAAQRRLQQQTAKTLINFFHDYYSKKSLELCQQQAAVADVPLPVADMACGKALMHVGMTLMATAGYGVTSEELRVLSHKLHEFIPELFKPFESRLPFGDIVS